MLVIRLVIFFFTLAQFNVYAAEVIAIDVIEDYFLCSSAPSMTIYWQSLNPKVTLLVIPGGNGLVGITTEKKDLK